MTQPERTPPSAAGLAASLLCLALAGSLQAQPSQSFVDSVDVQVVEVDVVVTDRNGSPVRGLSRVELAPHAGRDRRVEYRRSYRDKTRDELLAERLISAAYLGASPNPLGVSVALGATTPRDRKIHRLPVNIVVPEEAVLTVPGAGGRAGMLRLLLMTIDQDRRGRGPVRQMTVPVGPAGDVQAADGIFRFEVSVSLAEGDHHLVVGVRDETTGELSLIGNATSVPSR